jgi:hypothetical protein
MIIIPVIEWLKKQWREVFFQNTSFFHFDGWFGWDKIGHFSRHVIFVLVALWLGAKPFAIVWYDTLFDILYEYKDYCRGNGFSLMDVVYGRSGMALVLLLWTRL